MPSEHCAQELLVALQLQTLLAPHHAEAEAGGARSGRDRSAPCGTVSALQNRNVFKLETHCDRVQESTQRLLQE